MNYFNQILQSALRNLISTNTTFSCKGTLNESIWINVKSNGEAVIYVPNADLPNVSYFGEALEEDFNVKLCTCSHPYYQTQGPIFGIR